MDDDAIFTAVARLVADGEYLDSIPGRPGVDLDGDDGWFIGGLNGSPMQRMYTRGSRRYLAAKAQGWIEPLPPLQPAPLAAVEEAEALAGAALPPLLRRLYLEVGNGGFGPGYGGLVGLRGGHHGGAATASLTRRKASDDGPCLSMLMCEWGCGINTIIDLADGQMWGTDPHAAPDGGSLTFPVHMTISRWFGRWLENHMLQPWLIQDSDTGQVRGPTEAEQAESWETGLRNDDPDD